MRKILKSLGDGDKKKKAKVQYCYPAKRNVRAKSTVLCFILFELAKTMSVSIMTSPFHLIIPFLGLNTEINKSTAF